MATRRHRLARVALAVLALAGVSRPATGEEPEDAADARRLEAALRATESHGPDAVAAAAALPEGALTLRELRRKADLLAPRAAWDPDVLGSDAPTAPSWAGARELPAILHAMSLARPDAPEVLDLHRIALPEHVPALLAGLDRGGPNAFATRMGCLRILADSGGSDRFHDALVAAFLYSGVRHEAEEAGRPPPPFAGVCGAATAGPGLPEAFERLARAAWNPDDAGADLRGGPTVGRAWLWRWALRLRPTVEDVPFLVEATEWKIAPESWVFEGLASLDDPTARAEVEEWAQASGIARAAIATEEARRGSLAALRDLQKEGRPEREASVAAERAALVSWSLDPERARAEWLDRFLAEEDPSQVEPELDLGGRWLLGLEGVDVRDEDLRRIGDEILRRKAPARHLCWWFTRIDPDALTPALAATICARLAEHRDGLEYWAESGESDVDGNVSLGVLEGQDREAVRRLLRLWARSSNEDVRREALVDLARLGDDAFVDEMIASWLEWDLDSHRLGNVRHPKVREFLRSRARSDRPEDAEEVTEAVGALLAWHGLGLRFPYVLSHGDPSWTREPHRSARAALLAGDAVGALVRLSDDVLLEDLAFVDDPRVTARLREILARRDEDRSWAATGVLALAGDPVAAAEVRGFAADARTVMLDEDSETLWATLAGDPSLVDLWVSRIDANCCLSFHVKGMLRRVFPTVPTDNGAGHLTPYRRSAERWFARHRGRFVWSRLLAGWVPGPAR